MDQEFQKNKDKLKYLDNGPNFLADSNCLSAFGSKLNLDKNVIPMKQITKIFDESKIDYIERLEELQQNLHYYHQNSTYISKNLEKSMKNKEPTQMFAHDELDLVCEMNKKKKQYQKINQMIAFNEIRIQMRENDKNKLRNMFDNRQKAKNQKIFRKIKNVVKMIQFYNFGIEHLLNVKYSKDPFQHRLAKSFFTDIKENNIEKVQNILKDEPNLVYEFDKDHLTALHWAAKNEILVSLINAKSFINHKDLLGRTPLYHAVSSNSYDTTRLLVAFGADLFILPLLNIKLKNLTRLFKQKQ